MSIVCLIFFTINSVYFYLTIGPNESQAWQDCALDGPHWNWLVSNIFSKSKIYFKIRIFDCMWKCYCHNNIHKTDWIKTLPEISFEGHLQILNFSAIWKSKIMFKENVLPTVHEWSWYILLPSIYFCDIISNLKCLTPLNIVQQKQQNNTKFHFTENPAWMLYNWMILLKQSCPYQLIFEMAIIFGHSFTVLSYVEFSLHYSIFQKRLCYE